MSWVAVRVALLSSVGLEGRLEQGLRAGALAEELLDYRAGIAGETLVISHGDGDSDGSEKNGGGDDLS